VLSCAALASAPASAKKKQPPAPPAPAGAAADTSEVLVRIGSQPITRADVQRRLDELPEGVRANFTTPEGRQQLLERMVEERVWMLTAEKAGVPDRPKVVQQLAQQRRDLIIRTYLTELMATNPAPGDSEIKAFYDAHVSEYRVPATVTVRHIQTRTRDRAVRVLGLARAKQDWNKLCMRYSTDTLSRGNGGNLGSVTHEGQFAILGRQPALAESAFALGAGKIGGPFKTTKGWHVLKIDDVVSEGVRPLDQMRGVIMRQVSSQRSQDFYQNQLEQARKSLGVAPDSAAIKRYVSQKKDAREMFKDAQEKGTPEDRIAAYRQLLVEYPASDVSPQAAFMIGFIYSEELKNYDMADKAFRSLLARYPTSELAASAQWMVDHMRTEEAPAFIQSAADSIKTSPPVSKASRTPTSKP
jgi:tetratricopeptide (TPR) repeat protein